MSGFRISKAAIATSDDMFDSAELCQNTTVGPNKYQLFCLTATDLDGSCKKLPTSLTSAGELNCVDVISQPYLQRIYDTTGMACAVNCYYPLGVNLPTYSYSYSYSYSYNYPSGTYSFPSATYTYPGFSTATDTVIVLPTSTNGSVTGGGASMMDPNFLFTFMAVLMVMILCVHRAI